MGAKIKGGKLHMKLNLLLNFVLNSYKCILFVIYENSYEQLIDRFGI